MKRRDGRRIIRLISPSSLLIFVDCDEGHSWMFREYQVELDLYLEGLEELLFGFGIYTSDVYALFLE